MTAFSPAETPELCDCDDCLDDPCQMDCEDDESACEGCRDSYEALLDDEFEKKSALGIL